MNSRRWPGARGLHTPRYQFKRKEGKSGCKALGSYDWTQITSYLAEKGYKVILMGKNRYEIDNTIYIETGLREAMLLINKAKIWLLILIEHRCQTIQRQLNPPITIKY